jgi:hypothetical protein
MNNLYTSGSIRLETNDDQPPRLAVGQFGPFDVDWTELEALAVTLQLAIDMRRPAPTAKEELLAKIQQLQDGLAECQRGLRDETLQWQALQLAWEATRMAWYCGSHGHDDGKWEWVEMAFKAVRWHLKNQRKGARR